MKSTGRKRGVGIIGYCYGILSMLAVVMSIIGIVAAIVKAIMWFF